MIRRCTNRCNMFRHLKVVEHRNRLYNGLLALSALNTYFIQPFKICPPFTASYSDAKKSYSPFNRASYD